MGLLNIIRQMALREKQSIWEISRRTGLSRNTIAKYLSAGTIEPTFTVPERPSKLDPFANKLSCGLKTEAGRTRKQRRTLKQLHADLMALGFTGSYGRVAAFARDWRTEQQTAGRGIFIPCPSAQKAKGKAGQIAETLVRLGLLILNELGYLPFSATGGALLFHLLSKLYERTSVIITTNLSFSE